MIERLIHFLAAVLAVVWIVFVVALVCPAFAQESLPILKFRAIDGDTVIYGGVHYRLKGYNAPESFKSQCRAEHMLGVLAKKQLAMLLNSGGIVSFAIDPAKDKYGRGLMTITLNGRPLSDIMVSAGLAETYDCPNNRCPRRADWCAKQ